ncbi:DUF4097 family beta strand repeat-containing protein [Eggerthellaceae bacterium PR-HUZ602407-17]
MTQSRKFTAHTKDIGLTIKRADAFNITYSNCKKDIFQIEENQNGIKLVQTEKVPSFHWLSWLSKGAPEVIVSLPEHVDVCEIEAESNQVLITDIQVDAMYAEVHNGKVEARNVKANDIFLKCLNGSAVAANVEATHACTLDTLNGTSVLEGTITPDACVEVGCENGSIEVSEKHKANLGYKADGRAHYIVHCMNGKAVVQ